MITTHVLARGWPAVVRREPAGTAAGSATARNASADPAESNRFSELFDSHKREIAATGVQSNSGTDAANHPAKSPQSVPTVEELFGPNPWLENPTGAGPNGKTWSYNPRYFATRQAAETVAAMVGGKVVEQNQFCPFGPLVQMQPNLMVQLSNGRVFNAGEFIGLFSHGYPQSYVDRLIQQELTGEVKA